MSTMPRNSKVVIVGLLALAGCSKSVACTAEARTSLVVHVVDTTGRSVCDATVVARDGSFSRRLDSARIG